MKTKIIATSVALLMSTTAFAKDCKYVQKIILDDNNAVSYTHLTLPTTPYV